MNHLDAKTTHSQPHASSNQSTKLFFFFLFLASILAFSIQVSNATTMYARSSGDWSNPMNWSLIGPTGPTCGFLPGAMDSVVIDGWAISVQSMPVMVNAVMIRNSNPGNANLTIERGMTLTVTGNLWVESMNQSNHVDLYVQDANSTLTVMGNLTLNRASSNLQVDRLRMLVKDRSFVNISGDLNYYYSNAGPNENNEEFVLEDDCACNVFGNVLFQIDNGNNFNASITDQADFNVSGNFTTLLNGGNDLEINIQESATVDVSGSYYANLDGGGNNSLKLGTYAANSSASLTIAGNLEFDHNGNAAGDDMYMKLFGTTALTVGGDILMDSDALVNDRLYLEANEDATISVSEDIQPVAAWSGIVSVDLNDNSMLRIEGDYIRQAAPNAYGSLMSLDNSTVAFEGTSQQTIVEKWGNGGDEVRFMNVIINNSYATSPQLLVEDNIAQIEILGQLNLVDGVIDLEAGQMSLGVDASVVNQSQDSYVVATETKGGLIIKGFDNTGYFQFPIGDPDDYTPFTITFNAGTHFTGGEMVEMQVEDALHPNNSDADHITRYWNVSIVGFSGAASYDVSYIYTDADVVGNEALLLGSRHNGGWTDYDQVDATNNLLRSSTGISQLGYNAFSSGKADVLPIELLAFEGKEAGNAVSLNWTTAVEINNDYFIVQRSIDGEYFEEVGQVMGAGNSYSPLNYTFTDAEPYWGVSYYRLVQVDLDGTENEETPIAVQFTGDRNAQAKVYPNPVRQGQSLNIEVNVASDQEVLVVLLDHFGREVYSKVTLSEKDGMLQGIDASNSLAPGVYFIVASSNNEIYKQKLVISGSAQSETFVMK
jgi:hypothetical protein